METPTPTLRLRKNEDPSNLTDTNDVLQQNPTKNRQHRRPSNDVLFCCVVILVSFSIVVYRSSSIPNTLVNRLKEEVFSYLPLDVLKQTNKKLSRKRVDENDSPEWFKDGKIFTEEENWPCEEKMLKRRQRVENMCKKFLSSDQTSNSTTLDNWFKTQPTLTNIWVNSKRKLAVCIPHKVASQMWRYFFHKLDKKDSGISINEERIQFGDELPHDILQYLVAFQVRHPLERLLSSYRFLFERHQTRVDLIELVKDIFHHLAINSKHGEIDLNTQKVKEAIEKGDEEEINWFEVTPSFQQFANYISNPTASGADFGISKSRMGNHWLPFYLSCNPCYEDTMPRYLIHMETLDTDIKCFLENTLNKDQKEKLDIEESDFQNLYHVNISPGGHSSQEKLKRKYFGQLSKEEMRNFYERYKEDFLLNGYKIDSFFSYAHDFDDSAEYRK